MAGTICDGKFTAWVQAGPVDPQAGSQPRTKSEEGLSSRDIY